MAHPTTNQEIIRSDEQEITSSTTFHRLKPTQELGHDEARQRLLDEVRQHSFWSRRAARKMKLTSIRKRPVYVYKLSSLCEMRQVERRFDISPGSAHANRPIFDISPVTIPPPDSLVRLQCNGDQQQVRRNSESSGLASSRRDAQASSSSSSNESKPKADPNKVGSSSLTDVSLMCVTTACLSRNQSLTSKLVSSNNSLNKLRLPGFERPNAFEGSEPTAINPETIWSIRTVSVGAHRSARRLSKCNQNKIESMPLPGSSKIDTCYGCQGKGQFKCKSCNADGTTLCIGCAGQGSTRILSSWSRASNKSEPQCSAAECFESSLGLNSSLRNDFGVIVAPTESRRFSSSSAASGSDSPWIIKTCHFCHGIGQNRCTKCGGKSHAKCELCQGSGNLRSYLNLDTIISDNSDDQVITNPDLVPTKLLRLCTGQLLFEQSASRLKPLNLGDKDSLAGENGKQDCETIMENVRLASRKLLKNHHKMHRDKLMIRQRHSLVRIDCYLVRYQWRRKSGQFVIYGNERKIFIDKYPFKSCCNII